MARTRVQQGGAIAGGQRFNAATELWTNQGEWVAHKYTNTCVDTVGDKVSPNGLDISKTRYEPQPMNGITSTGHIYQGWIPTALRLIPSHISTGIPSESTSTNHLMERSNPGRVRVSVGRSLAELRDVPHLIKQGGDIFRRYISGPRGPRDYSRALNSWRAMQDTSGAYIGYQFGIKPIIQDLERLLDLEEHVNRRVGELQRFYSKGGLRRRLDLFSAVESETSNITLESGAGIFGARRTRTTSVHRWGTIRWKPTGAPQFRPSPARYRTLARAAVLGLGSPWGPLQGGGHAGIDFGDYWDIIPWSWMTDWCVDIGSYLHAGNNRIPCRPGVMCIMTKTESKYEWTRNDANGSVSGGTGTSYRTSKVRAVRTSASLPTADIPFLGHGRLSILSALAATRNRTVSYS